MYMRATQSIRSEPTISVFCLYANLETSQPSTTVVTKRGV